MFAIKEDCTAHGSQKGTALRELSDDGHRVMHALLATLSPGFCSLVSLFFSESGPFAPLFAPPHNNPLALYFSECPVNLSMTSVGRSPSKGFLSSIGCQLWSCLSKGHF